MFLLNIRSIDVEFIIYIFSKNKIFFNYTTNYNIILAIKLKNNFLLKLNSLLNRLKV